MKVKAVADVEPAGAEVMAVATKVVVVAVTEAILVGAPPTVQATAGSLLRHRGVFILSRTVEMMIHCS